MLFFVSAGEPSGDLHAANLIRRLGELDGSATFLGFGGPKMAAAGCAMLYPLVDHPVMGFAGAFKSLGTMVRLLSQAEAELRARRPDAVILVDYPGFNFQLARRARRLGMKVIYFVPPQIWSWGSWRAAKVRRDVDLVLATLPFEETWYRQRGISQVRYVGHPFFDDLAAQRLDQAFLHHQESRRPRRVVALLPGSRPSELRLNLRPMVRAAEAIDQQVPGLRFLFAAHREADRAAILEATRRSWLPFEIHAAKTREILSIAEAAIAVSGSVSLELLYYGVPSTILYHVSPMVSWLGSALLKTPYISLVNLLAGQKVFPEFFGFTDQGPKTIAPMVRWLTEPEARRQVTRHLAALKRAYGQVGAIDVSARQILDFLARKEDPVRLAG